MRMIETPRELGFTQEALTEALVPRQLRSEQFQRHATPTRDLFGEIDGAHRPLADYRLHAEPGEHSSGENGSPHRLLQAWQATPSISRPRGGRLGLNPQPSNA